MRKNSIMDFNNLPKMLSAMMLTGLLFSTFYLFSCLVSVKQEPLDVVIHSRVDTSDTEIKMIAHLWINYLKSSPDSVYNNPYWNNAEKEKFPEFDFSRRFLFQFPAKQLLTVYKPTILSIVKENEAFVIRTIFYDATSTVVERKSNPWCISKVYAIKEGNVWKLQNALPVITKNWEKTKVGNIQFVYPFSHSFNHELAKASNSFCESLKAKFNFLNYSMFDFYITDNPDEMGKLLNFDFYFAGYTTGVGLNENRILLSGMGSEYYPHELVHMILPHNIRHPLIEEGFATWQGGARNKSFEENVRELAKFISSHPEINLDGIINNNDAWEAGGVYPTGAILLDAVYKKKGASSVKELLDLPNDVKKIKSSLSVLLEVKEKDLNLFWKNLVLTYTDSKNENRK